MILDWVGALKETHRCCDGEQLAGLLWTGAVEGEAVWDLHTEEKEPTKAQRPGAKREHSECRARGPETAQWARRAEGRPGQGGGDRGAR